MRSYQRILLVVALTIAMIAGGVAWERFYLLPLVEEAQHKPDPPESLMEELPAECLEELAAMGPPPAVVESRPGKPIPVDDSSASGPSPTADDNTRQPGSGMNQLVTHIQVTDSMPFAPTEAADPHDATPRPIHQAQSADWAEPVAQPTAGSQSQRRPQAGTLPASAEDPIPHNELRNSLTSVDALDLIRRLRADDSDQAAAARRELQRRGFSEVDLELGKQLFSPDAETRKRLARAVPRLSSVDAAQWLMWLALDPQPEVRLAAVSTLATTGDPALLERVEALARNDRDPQIQALAEQIAKQRDLAASRGNSSATRGMANPIR